VVFSFIPRYIHQHCGGPDGELGASLRYLSQRFSMPYKEVVGTLTDIGTEELAHLEMICTMIYQLTRNLSIEEIKAQGFADYFVDHTTGIWPSAATGMPFSSTVFQSKGDIITDLHEDMAADAAPSYVQTVPLKYTSPSLSKQAGGYMLYVLLSKPK